MVTEFPDDYVLSLQQLEQRAAGVFLCMAVPASVHRCVATHAWQLLLCCLVATWFHTTSGAKFQGVGGGAEDWVAEIRRVPKLIVRHDSSGTKNTSLSESFVKNDMAATGGYTHPTYNCTVAVLAEGCEGGQLSLPTKTSEGIYINDARHIHTLAHAPSGLLYGGNPRVRLSCMP